MSLLDSVKLFDSLDARERDTLALYCQERFLPKGEILFNEGDDATALYVVKSGLLKAYKDRSDGENIIGNIGPDELVGEMALFDPGAPKLRMASVKALNDSLLVVIMDYAVVELSKKSQEVYGKITEIIAKRKKEL